MRYSQSFASLMRLVLFVLPLAGYQGVFSLPADTTQIDEHAPGLNPYPNKPKVTFKPDGTFKLTVFSDLHLGENPWEDWGPAHDKNTTALMRQILADEKPDYAAINGDLMTGENTFKTNNTRLIDQYVRPFNEARVPFSTTQGNHDNQPNITHFTEITYERKASPFSYTRLSAPGVGGLQGDGNYWVPVYRKASDIAPVLILWFFDSRGGWTSEGLPVPDWVDATVADWIQSETKAMERAWGPAERRSAVAFVHIPPHIVQELQKTINPEDNPGLNADTLGRGSSQATGDETLGSDGPFWDAVSGIKNLRAIISGHDHGNEWCAREATKGVVFCFNKHSGYGGYGSTEWDFGVRNLMFSSPSPSVPVKTWIRLRGGETRAAIELN